MIDANVCIGALNGCGATPDQLSAYVDELGGTRAIISNLDAVAEGANLDEPDANLAALSAQQRDARLTPLYWVRIGAYDSHPRALLGALESAPFVGAFFSPGWNRFRYDDPRLDTCLDVVERLQKVAVLHVGAEPHVRPIRAYEATRRHPQLRALLVGAGGGPQWKEAIDVVTRCERRDGARVYVATTGAKSAEIVAAIKQTNPQRWLFGSDFGAYDSEQAAQASRLIRSLQAHLPSAAHRAITHDNAEALFNLSGAAVSVR